MRFFLFCLFSWKGQLGPRKGAAIMKVLQIHRGRNQVSLPVSGSVPGRCPYPLNPVKNVIHYKLSGLHHDTVSQSSQEQPVLCSNFLMYFFMKPKLQSHGEKKAAVAAVLAAS